MAFLDIDNLNQIPAAETVGGGGGGKFLKEEGVFNFLIREASLRPTKNNQGKVLHITLEVVGGDHEGEIVKNYVTTHHTSAQAQDIGRRALSSLRLAAGLDSLTETSQLEGLAVQAEVRLGEPYQDYEPKSEVYKWIPATASGAPSDPNGATEGNAPVWG